MSLQNGQRSPAVILNGALRAGLVIKPDVCDVCKRKLVLYSFQPDPSEPLDVLWLCRWCADKPKYKSFTSTSDVSVSLRFSASLYWAARSLAKEDGRSVSSTIRRLVEQHSRIKKKLGTLAAA